MNCRAPEGESIPQMINGEKLIITRTIEKDLIHAERGRRRPTILGKGSFEQIFGDYASPKSSDLVAGYELFLRESDLHRPLESLPFLKPGIIKGAHAVNSLSWQGKDTVFDLSDPGRFGDACETALVRTIGLVAGLDGEYVVVHIGKFKGKDHLSSDTPTLEEMSEAYHEVETERILTACNRLQRVNGHAREKNIVLAVENDPLSQTNDWVGLGQGILHDPQTLNLLLENTPTAIKVILDEEHLYRAAAMQPAWKTYLQGLLRSDDLREPARLATEQLARKVQEETASRFFEYHIKPFVEEMIEGVGVRLFGFHVCGWDFRKDSYYMPFGIDGTSIHDGHLPPRRVVKSIDGEGVPIMDAIDHRHTLQTSLNVIGLQKFLVLQIVLEHSRERSQSRVYSLHTAADQLVAQKQDLEFAIAARSLRFLVSQLIGL